MALNAFKTHRLVVPMTVLEELDHIKDRRDKDVSREARIAIGAIDKVMSNASPQQIQDGVPIPHTATKANPVAGTLSIFQDQKLSAINDIPYLCTTTDHAKDKINHQFY